MKDDFELIDDFYNTGPIKKEKSIFIDYDADYFSKQKPSSQNSSSESLSLFQNLKKNLCNLKNIVTFNIYEGNSKIDQGKATNQFSKAYIFSTCYDLSSNNEQTMKAFIEAFQELIWFSYRKNFKPIHMKDRIFTSDAGWGCMVRATQMFIANAICKLNDLTFDSFMNESIYQFLEDPIEIEYFLNNEKHISGFREYIQNKQAHSNERLSLIYPPFSVRNMCKDTNVSNKSLGQWFSNLDTMRIMKEIHKEFQIKCKNDPIDFYHFSDYCVEMDEIIKKSFQEINCECIKFIKNDFKISQTSDKDFQCVDIETTESQCDCKKKYFTYNDKLYKLHKKFFLFISVRHGLYSLNEDIEKEVLDYFTYPYNIGFIGGKGGRALYFIGKCGKEVFFLDPHYVQEAVTHKQVLLGEGMKSYQALNVYKVDIKEISPCFTLGFVIKSTDEFKKFVEICKENEKKNDFERLFSLQQHNDVTPINKLDINNRYFKKYSF